MFLDRLYNERNHLLRQIRAYGSVVSILFDAYLGCYIHKKGLHNLQKRLIGSFYQFKKCFAANALRIIR